MPSPPRIPIPFRLRVARMRRRLGPPLVFITCAVMAATLWMRHTGTVGIYGEVHAVRLELATLTEGRLVSLGSGEIEAFQHVSAGQVLARLDDRPTLAAIAVIQSELAQSRAELAAAAARFRQDRHDLERAQELNRQRLAIEVEERRLDVLDRAAALAADRIEVQRLEAELNQIRRLVEQQAETEFALVIAQLRHDLLVTRIGENEQALHLAISNARAAETRLVELPDIEAAELDVVLTPLRAAITVHERRLSQVALEAESLEVRAPVSGMILEVHLRPGEVALPGTPIATLADPTAEYIVAYIPEANPLRPEPGHAVQIRPLGMRAGPASAQVLDIGSQVVLLPEHLRRDPSRAEWGLPIRIALPAELPVHPGELVQLRVLR